METMTYTTTTLRPQRFARRIWHWLKTYSRARTSAARLCALSDHMLRDVGIDRDRIDQTSIRTQHDAMRYSG
jgi:uncharacterized protein YjiS (DUF1127 family)